MDERLELVKKAFDEELVSETMDFNALGWPERIGWLIEQAERVEELETGTLNITTSKIQQWAKDRNLHTADPDKQMLKLMEEVGELAQGLAKTKESQIVDSIGDIYVVLTILSMQLEFDISECIEYAYNEIKDRKGQMVNGVFVKEDDL